MHVHLKTSQKPDVVFICAGGLGSIHVQEQLHGPNLDKVRSRLLPGPNRTGQSVISKSGSPPLFLLDIDLILEICDYVSSLLHLPNMLLRRLFTTTQPVDRLLLPRHLYIYRSVVEK